MIHTQRELDYYLKLGEKKCPTDLDVRLRRKIAQFKEEAKRKPVSKYDEEVIKANEFFAELFEAMLNRLEYKRTHVSLFAKLRKKLKGKRNDQ